MERVIELAEQRGGAFALVARHGDGIILEHYHGCGPETLFFAFSVTKPFTALAVHLLAARGELQLDRPIADYWPGYAVRGKSAITTRHVLTHRAGVPSSTPHVALDMATMADTEASVRRAERARPRWPAGARVAYHVVSFGFILGEIVRRVDGRPIDRFLADEVFGPLGLDAYLGLPPGEAHRTLPLRPLAGNIFTPHYCNRPATRRAVIPAASLHITARSLAEFYRVLLRGTRDAAGRQAVPAAAVAALLEVSCDGEVDATLHQRQRYGQGIQLGGLPGVHRGLGNRSHPQAFGHNGSSVCNAWADPTRDLVWAHLTNTCPPIRRGLALSAAMSDTVLDTFDGSHVPRSQPTKRARSLVSHEDPSLRSG
jgi:CubicO group peptidase (beta-lactamase class C family)